MDRDKSIEQERYDGLARAQLLSKADFVLSPLGSVAIRQSLRSPYLLYERLLCARISANHKVLELAAGSGMHTNTLLQTGARVIATDISLEQLRLLEKVVQSKPGRLEVKFADMESLPFADGSFDTVACAGGLSYGDNRIVLKEIYRVLKPGGQFIAVDSLNHNPIYRLNRFVHYIRGHRSRSTLLRMPTLKLLDEYNNVFAMSEVEFFGAASWLMAPIAKIIGESRAAEWSDRLDKILRVKRSAFKFVMTAKKTFKNAA